MKLIQKLKIHFKDAGKEGKIVRMRRKDLSWTKSQNQFVSNLNCAEWREFEEQEAAFRRPLSSQGGFDLIFDFKFFRHGGHVNRGIDLQWAVLILTINKSKN